MGVSHLPPFLSLGTDEEERENLLKSSKAPQPEAACLVDRGERTQVWEMSRERWGQRGRILRWVSYAFLLFIGSLWAACSLIQHCLRQGGQRGAVALAGQHPPGSVPYLCSHPHFGTVGVDNGKLLPVSAGLPLGRLIRELWWPELLS